MILPIIYIRIFPAFPSIFFDEMSHFFSVYKQLEGKDTVIDDVKDAQTAIEIVQFCIDNYIEKYCK